LAQTRQEHAEYHHEGAPVIADDHTEQPYSNGDHQKSVSCKVSRAQPVEQTHDETGSSKAVEGKRNHRHRRFQAPAALNNLYIERYEEGDGRTQRTDAE